MWSHETYIQDQNTIAYFTKNLNEVKNSYLKNIVHKKQHNIIKVS